MGKDTRSILQHLTPFLEWLAIEEGLSSKSQENYARFLKRFLDWLKNNNLEDLKPHELTSEHIRKYRFFLAKQVLPKTKEPLKRSTQSYYLIALRSLLNYFTDHDIASLPTEKVKLAKEKGERQVHFLTLRQLEELFSAPNISVNIGLRDRAILEAFFSTGLRVAELVSLNRDQFKLKPGMKELELSIVGKGRRIRPVYFSERALYWLDKYLQTRKDKENALFIHYRSKKETSLRLTPRAIEKAIKKYAIMAGVPLTTTPHVMRHSFATDLLAQGVDIRTLQEFLGHKSIAATQIYAHVTSKQLRDIHRKYHSGRKLKI